MKTAVASSSDADARIASIEIIEQVMKGLGEAPRALLIFSTPTLDHKELLRRLIERFPDCMIAGASSAGEFMNSHLGDGMVCALGLSGEDVKFSLGIGRNVAADAAGAANSIVSSFQGLTDYKFPHRSALVMMDVLAGHADVLVDELTLATAGQYQFFGGGAGDNAQFRQTPVFWGRESLNGSAVALEILSSKPIGVGVRHGWEPASKAYRVTESEGARLFSLNGLPAVEIFEAHAGENGHSFERADPIPFFLHNILGIDTGVGHRLRVPIAVLADGSLLCAAEVPTGSVVHVMRSSAGSAVQAAENATDAALAALGSHKPQAAIFFDCVATRLRMGDRFNDEVSVVRSRLNGADLMGCNTHGQIARAEGQFEGFHNCTAVVAIIPE